MAPKAIIASPASRQPPLGNLTGIPMALQFDPARNLRLAFTTPIAEFRIPDAVALNEGLAAILREREAMDGAGIGKSNIGGWHSTGDLVAWPHDEIKQFTDAIREAILTMVAMTSGIRSFDCDLGLSAWANISRHGGYNRAHNHPNNHWSGVYYVDPGDPVPDQPFSGLLEFTDPRGAINMHPSPGKPFGEPVKVAPEAGKMVLFPAWLAHHVHPYYGTRDRISIAFNANITNFREKGGSQGPANQG